MKICMFTNTYVPHIGGVARSVHFFAEDLRALHHQVLVVAPTFPEQVHAHEDKGRVLRVPAVQNFNGSDFSVRIPLPFIIAQGIHAFEPDIIHSHHPFLMGDAALRAARRHNLPLIFTHHTLYEEYTHYVPLDSPALKKFVVDLSTRYANLCDRVAAPSASIAHMIRQRGVIRPVTEIPTGVDIEFFARGRRDRFRKSCGISEDSWVTGHLGRLAPEKNLRYLTEAVAEFVSRHDQACFLVVGNGPSRREISRIFAAKNLSPRLIMAGSLSGQDLSDAYSAMDLFVFSSQSETQGMVLLEAMAAGKPVVALDASGVREVMRDGQNGRLLPADASRQRFADAIEEFFQNPVTADHWRRCSLETARSLSREICARRLESLYQLALDEYEAAGKPEIPAELDPWESLLEGIKLEWELLLVKTSAAVDAIRSSEHSKKHNSHKPKPKKTNLSRKYD
jgi:1,2-diacylglycerol 3-alpha-glucosyltransferase